MPNACRGFAARTKAFMRRLARPEVQALASGEALLKARIAWTRHYGYPASASRTRRDGRVVADLQDPTGAYSQTTGVTETADRQYVQNLHLNVLGWKAR